jgi:hypothetical protein
MVSTVGADGEIHHASIVHEERHVDHALVLARGARDTGVLLRILTLKRGQVSRVHGFLQMLLMAYMMRKTPTTITTMDMMSLSFTLHLQIALIETVGLEPTYYVYPPLGVFSAH